MFEFAPGSTSKSVYFLLRDAASAQPKTGRTASSPGVKCAYTRERGSAVPITLSALALPTSAYASGGFIEVDATAQPGNYRLDLPDAALASGANYVLVTLSFDNVIGEGALVLLRNPVNNTGPGAISHTVTVQTSAAVPIANAEVWVSTDAAGTNVIAGTLLTNSLGQCVFTLDAGSYYLWVSHPDYTASNPTAFTVS